MRSTTSRVLCVAAMLALLFGQVTWALAGTTGGIAGIVQDASTFAPIAGAKVTVLSPSQTASEVTDASGHFAFIALAPDTYTVSVEKNGFQALSVPGQVVFADTMQSVTLRMTAALKTIARVTSRSAGSLVRSGTTADVYSVNAATQSAVAGVGGGGGLNSAYSAIATVPGAFVPLNQNGYFQTIHIRGGDFDQVGYEFDGVPINRSFDNYPSSGASSLGNAEVQVYTGATPANSEGEGLAGYINQVIKSGTYPGFATASLGIGSPTFYHRAAIEAGGATPNRSFSYYAGVSGFNQDFRYVDQSNAAKYQSWLGAPLALNQPSDVDANGNCPGSALDASFSYCYANGFAGPGGYQLGATTYALAAGIASRDAVMNFHFAIPHRNDSGKDDVQLMWDSSMLHNPFAMSDYDTGVIPTGAPASALGSTSLGTPVYLDGFQWNCKVGQVYTSNAIPSSCVSTYFFPGSSTNRSTFAAIDPFARDTTWNNQEIFKAQYQKNIGSNAYLRLYGYSYYSDWLQNGPQCAYSNFFCGASPDYELSSHTRGVSLAFADQLNTQHLLNIQGSYTTASTVRDNNTQMFNFAGSRSRGIVVVNAADPYSGFCYDSTGTMTSCSPYANAAQFTTWKKVGAGSVAALPGSCPDPNTSSTACGYLVAENSLWATYNTVTPKFTAVSFTDQWRPNDKLLLNVGLRLDRMQFIGENTNLGSARQFWFNAWNRDNCINSATGLPVDITQLTGASINPVTGATTCPTGYTTPAQSAIGALQNVPSQVEAFNVLQPRISGTYTINPDTVLRASYGRYAEAANAAFEQYNTLEEDLPFALLGTNFYQYGRTTPGSPIKPQTSNNYDFSFEKHLHGTDISLKLTPFYRQTQNQIQNFFLNQQTGFISGLNVGSQTSKGVEFQLQKGDFARNGFSGLLSATYTYSTIKYGSLPNGTTILSPINASIANYNAYTSACAPGGKLAGKTQFGQSLCGTTVSGAAAAPCYTAAGLPDPSCAAGDYGNPYWNAPGQNLINPSQEFPTYDIFPAGIGSSAQSFGTPYTATMVLSYRHDKWAITPSLQFQAGARYGSPESMPGVAPDSACGTLAPGTDPRYPYGNPGPNTYNAMGCTDASVVIPDPYTKQFDSLGAFVQPSQIMLNLQMSYDVSPRITLVGTFANLVDSCWGGTKQAWTVTDHNICAYGIVEAGLIPPVGNVYNPGAQIMPALQFPYLGTLSPTNVDSSSEKQPFQFFLETRIKL